MNKKDSRSSRGIVNIIIISRNRFVSLVSLVVKGEETNLYIGVLDKVLV
jgi:hypothetical protein